MKKTSSPRPASHLTLREVQAQLQAAILGGDDAILASLVDGPHASRGILFGVYRHAYTARLIEVLMGDYPLLCTYVGDERFRHLAHSFIAAHPSRSQNVRWFGTEFPAFLEKHAAAPESIELAELAAIERSVADAFDSEDAPILGFADLAAHPPEHWATLTFAFHPSVTLLSAATNGFEIWKSLKEEKAPPSAVRLSSEEHLAVWRQGATPKVRRLPDEEAMMFLEAQRGVSFGVLCEMLATFDDPDGAPARAAGYLQAWLASEMLASAKLVAPSRRRRSQHSNA